MRLYFIFLLMLAFAMVAHWLACVWYVIGLEEVSEKSTVSWLYQFGETIQRPYVNFSMDTGPDEGSAYVTSLYFTLTSMTTVGFGNVSANTNAEKAFAVIVMLIGALMHAAIFGNVAAIIQKLYANRVRYHSRANEIKQFIRVHHIDGDLANRLEDYFHTTWSLSGGVDTREILATFPHEIQSDVCMHLYKGLLELPLFSQAPRGLVRMLSLQIRPVYVGPGEYLLMQNDVVNCIYYIASGSMEVLQGESVAAILGKGDLFGEDISRKVPIRRSNGDVRALTYCDIYYITRDLLQDVLHLYSDFSFKFSEKLELTYDLGASEKDIWRRGGLDSISEDEENEEETSDSPETGSDFTSSVIRNRFDMKSSGVPKRPNHFTANEPWRFYSRPRIRGLDFNEKEPLLSTPEDAPQLASRIRVLQPSKKQISLTEISGSNDQIDSAEVATLEWENEPFTITKDEEASESIDGGSQHFVVDSINIDIECGTNSQDLGDFETGSPRPALEKSYKSAKDSFLKQLRSNTEDRDQSRSNSIKLVYSDNESDDSENLKHSREDRVGFNDYARPARSPSIGMKRRSPNVSPTHSLNSNRSQRMRKSGSSLQRLEFPSSEGLQENHANQLNHQDSSRHLSPSPATDSPYVSISRLFALTPPPKDDNDSPYGIHYASTPSSPARFKDGGSKTSLRRNATSEFISPASSCGGLSDDVRSTASRRSRKMSTTNAPPPSLFASLLAQASKSPYADFVPPTIVRESTITCNCEEEESCSVCGDRDSSAGTMNDNLSSNDSEDGDERKLDKHIESNKSDSASDFEDRKRDANSANEPDFSSQISINYLFEPLTSSASIDLNVPSENTIIDSPDCLLRRKRQLMTRETAVYSSASQGDEDEPEDNTPKDKDYNIYKISYTSPSFDNISQNDKRTSNESIRTDLKENCSDNNFTDTVGSASINDKMTDENAPTRSHPSLVVTENRESCEGNRPREIGSPSISYDKNNCEETQNITSSSEDVRHSEVNCYDKSELSSVDEEFIASACDQKDNNLPRVSTEKQETGVIPPFFDEVIAKGSGTFDPTHYPLTSNSAHSSLSTVSSHLLPTFQCPGSLTDMSVSNAASRDSLGLANDMQFEDPFHMRKPTISGIHSTHSLNDVPNSHRKFAASHPLCFSEPHLQRPRTSPQDKHDDDDDDDSEFSDKQLEDIFKDVANARQAMERLQMILSSPEPNITSDLADTKETVKRLDQQVLHLNQDVTSLRSDVKMVLELLKGFKNGQIVNK